MDKQNADNLIERIHENPKMLEALMPVPPGDIPNISNRLELMRLSAKHAIYRELKAPGLFGRLFNVGSFLWLPIGAVAANGFGLYSAFGVILLFVLGTRKVWKLGTAPANKELQDSWFSERRLAQMKLIKVLGSWSRKSPTNEQVREFQTDTLGVMAHYVRNSRADHTGRVIFANLLAPDESGAYFDVVARDLEHRIPNARYEASNIGAVAKAYSTGDAVTVNDLVKEYPATQQEKKYRSILAVPLNNGSQILGIISIDSSEPYHFASCADDLITAIAPYTALLIESLMVQTEKGD